MIRVYLDWNIVSSLKKPELGELLDFIKENKDRLLFPYSPAHFSDLMKSYSETNVYFKKDIEMLNFLTEKHLIRWEKNNFEPLFGTPDEYFKFEKENLDSEKLTQLNFSELVRVLNIHLQDLGIESLGDEIKTSLQSISPNIPVNENTKEFLDKMLPGVGANSNMWDVITAYSNFSQKLLFDKSAYIEIRELVNGSGLKIESNAGNWNEKEVIQNINLFLSSINVKMTFDDLVNLNLNSDTGRTLYNQYINAFLLLDLLGYKADRLPKITDNLKNIQNDSEHSFYGACCDYFIVLDKGLSAKSKALFSHYNIEVEVVQPAEFLNSIRKVIHKRTEVNSEFIKEALKFLSTSESYERIPASEKCSIESILIKLPVFYFDFFNYAVYQYYEAEGVCCINFRKINKSYSNFLYFTELEILFDKILNFFQPLNQDEFQYKKRDFVAGSNRNFELIWHFEFGIIKLDKDPDYGRPMLTYAFRR